MKYLGEFEQLLLLAVLQRANHAYGVEIRQTILERAERDVSIGALYTTLGRLEAKGLVTGKMGESSAERGGRAKKFYSVTAAGQSALKSSMRIISKMSEGVSLMQPSLLNLSKGTQG